MEYDDEIVRVDKYWTMDSLVIEERQPKRPKTGFTKHTHKHTHTHTQTHTHTHTLSVCVDI